MKPLITVLFCAALLGGAPSAPAEQAPAMPALIPRPETLNRIEGAELTLTSRFTILVPEDSAEDRQVGEYLAAIIREHVGITLQVQGTGRLDAAAGTIHLFSSAADEPLGEEGYELTIRSNSIILSARRPAGLFWGVQTLRQLLPVEGRGGEAAVPCLRILDRPRHSWRGFMLDCSRHFMSAEFIKRTLDLMAYHKLNRFHWHLTDSQGWRLPIQTYPKLTEIGAARDIDSPQRPPAFYTPQDVRDILEHAKTLHITVIPEIEMPGHCGAALAAYPQLACEGGGHVFCAGKEEVFAFLFDVLDETVELFPDSPWIHIGGDERPKGAWDNCPRCRARMAELGLAGEFELQTWFMRRITDHLATRNRRAITWAVTQSDPYDPRDLADIGNDAIIQNWHGGAAFAARQGWDVINSDNRFVYLDYPPRPDPSKPKWMPVLDLEKVYAFDPVPPGLSAEQARHILGGEACLWTELIPQEQVDAQLFPRLLGLAEVVWSGGAARDFDHFQQRVRVHLQRLRQMGVEIPPVEP